jgi:putative CRISPR-associated protein (TIGR02619 family)
MPGHLTIVSTCGTSVLTQNAPRELGDLPKRHANAAEKDIPPADLAQLRAHVAARRKKLLEAEPDAARKLSAEINGLLALRAERRGCSIDHHIVHTDTWLGTQAATIVAEWLNQNGVPTSPHRIRDLRTDSLECFRLGLAALAAWLDEHVAGTAGLVFNLTGGFKSLSGYMQVLGMLHGAECVMLFETSEELLTIPRLPISLDVRDEFESHLAVCRRLDLKLPIGARETEGLSEGLLERIGTELSLSALGATLWRRYHNELYAKPREAPVKQIQFGPKFRSAFFGLKQEWQIRAVNERLDDLSRFLARPGEANLGKLDVKPLKGSHAPSTHECDAWAQSPGYRIFFHYDGKTAVLDDLRPGLGH